MDFKPVSFIVTSLSDLIDDRTVVNLTTMAGVRQIFLQIRQKTTSFTPNFTPSGRPSMADKRARILYSTWILASSRQQN